MSAVSSRKFAYQLVLVIAATFAIVSVIMIFITFPLFYQYFAKVKIELLRDMKVCKESAENMFHFVNEVEYFDPKRELFLDISQCRERRDKSFLLE